LNFLKLSLQEGQGQWEGFGGARASIHFSQKWDSKLLGKSFGEVS
jgi:hypothetical protein